MGSTFSHIESLCDYPRRETGLEVQIHTEDIQVPQKAHTPPPTTRKKRPRNSNQYRKFKAAIDGVFSVGKVAALGRPTHCATMETLIPRGAIRFRYATSSTPYPVHYSLAAMEVIAADNPSIVAALGKELAGLKNLTQGEQETAKKAKSPETAEKNIRQRQQQQQQIPIPPVQKCRGRATAAITSSTRAGILRRHTP